MNSAGYVFVVFPLACILAAEYFCKAVEEEKQKKVLLVIQLVLAMALFAVATFLQYAFKGVEMFSLAALILLPLITASVFLKTKSMLQFSVAAIVSFNLLFSAFYFPEMVSYQHGNDFGRYVKAHAGNETAFVMYHTADDFSTPFYAQQFPYKEVWSREDFRNVLVEKKNLLVIAPQHGIEEMNADSIPFEIIQQKNSFRMAKLNFKFLNHKFIAHKLQYTVYNIV